MTEMKAKLSEYLSRVRAGEELVITDRGRPVARVLPASDRESHLADLERRGLLKPAEKPLDPEFFSRPRPSAHGASLVDAVIEERRDGR